MSVEITQIRKFRGCASCDVEDCDAEFVDDEVFDTPAEARQSLLSKGYAAGWRRLSFTAVEVRKVEVTITGVEISRGTRQLRADEPVREAVCCPTHAPASGA